MPSYIIGSHQLIELGIAVSNIGEDAFQTTVNVTVPKDVVFNNVRMVTNPPVLCYLAEEFLVCNVGNPLLANTTVRLIL